MAETFALVASTIGLLAAALGLYTGWRSIQQSRRRIRVRLEAMSETVAIVVTNPGDRDVPLSGVRILTDARAALPLDALTEGHFPLSLGPGTSYKLPIRRDALVQVLERNGIGGEVRLQAEALDATGKGRRSAFVSLS